MSALVDPDLEAKFDRLSLVTLGTMVVVALIGATVADGPVPLQFNQDGFTSFVNPWAAAVALPLGGLLARVVTLKSPVVWVRWLGRILIEFFLVFEILAFVHAT